MPTETHYDVLGLSRDASAKDIKKAFRRIARGCHPDVVGDNSVARERFERARTAYNVLVDAEKRRLYDRGTSVRTVSELLTRDPVGIRVREVMRNKAPEEPSPGTDIFTVEKVCSDASSVTVILESRFPLPVSKIDFDLLEGSNPPIWARVSGLGPEGKFGADSGNLFVFLMPK
ncbi:MAG: J domain-containing protein [Candidatus Uhrbacteria bacterium]|nr:J domain-containing protein [Candidatus Uhrbacteria bacterium]